MLRALAAVVAVALLAAAAHAIIVHSDGYGSPHGYITLALAAGIAVGALSIGVAWGQGRRTVALAIGIALLAGEAFGLISTAERLVSQRDRSQAPIREAVAQREAAAKRIADLQADVSAAATSVRLKTAEIAKVAADRAAVDKAAERNCARNCRALLEQQVVEATRELEAARAEIPARVTAAKAAVTAAQANLAGMAVPPSPTPLADRLGLPGWSLDLLVAALGSLAANGLAAALLVFAGHGHARAHRTVTAKFPSSAIEQAPADAIGAPVALTVANAPEHAARFTIECLSPAPGRHAALDDLKAAYHAWCDDRGVTPLPDARIGRVLAELYDAVGLRVADINGTPTLIGAEIKPRNQLAKIA